MCFWTEALHRSKSSWASELLLDETHTQQRRPAWLASPALPLLPEPDNSRCGGQLDPGERRKYKQPHQHLTITMAATLG